jgi:hypothetical protein
MKSSEGTHQKGAHGGDARAGSGAEEGLRWQEAGEADAWAVGDECAVLGRGRGRKIRPVGGDFVLKGSGGEGGRRGGRRVEAERERERGGPGHGVEQHGGVASTL